MNELFKDKLLAREIYEQLMAELEIGLYDVEVKKTSLHLTNGAAFLGISPKKNWLDITIVLNHRLEHQTLKKAEQVSKSRWHNDMRLSALSDVDSKVLAAIQEAYDLRKK
ncbi:MAG: DUF5655 domain-containing protein [Streptococcaceae bacterium]|jgi:hypothetical protein|nr:DUF5655 domain-containing protein [Streptococcaceae bacterium]